jgi:outer membrane protein OmpA-like peptidoglycan-associated protein
MRSILVALAVLAQAAPALAVREHSLPALRVQVDKSKVDMKQHRLELRMSRPPAWVQITVTGESGAVLADQRHDFIGRPAGTPLMVTWTPDSDETVARIELHAYDTDGASYTVVLSPWQVTIPHEDVNFDTGSSGIGDNEVPKLEAAYAKLTEALANDKSHGRDHPHMTLFIAAHTDTVGGNAYNIRLSQARARSIAGWFRKRGVHFAIAYEGFGESTPLVKTADNVDEARNRRADFILADSPPAYRTSGFRPSWKRIP